MICKILSSNSYQDLEEQINKLLDEKVNDIISINYSESINNNNELNVSCLIIYI